MNMRTIEKGWFCSII